MFYPGHITSHTVWVPKPLPEGIEPELRSGAENGPDAADLIKLERISRERAYRNTRLQVDASFYNDSDMRTGYSLVIVYDAYASIPLLTARYYEDAGMIRQCLEGDHNPDSRTGSTGIAIQEPLFLIDRFSAHVSSGIYRKYRGYIHGMFYSEVFKHTKGYAYVLMARKEKGDKLLHKYLALGAVVRGTVVHKGREHWVLTGNVNESYARVRALQGFEMLRM